MANVKVINFFKEMGMPSYTRRHCQIVEDFIESKEKDVKILLNKLGDWDNNDLKIAESYFNQENKQ